MYCITPARAVYVCLYLWRFLLFLLKLSLSGEINFKRIICKSSDTFLCKFERLQKWFNHFIRARQFNTPVARYTTFGENTKYKWLNINRRAKIMKKDNILHTIKKLNKEEANKRMRPVNKYELMLHINICLFFLSSREL